MNNNSIWLDGFDKKTCSKLNDDIDVDVLIIGGGITGISTAYHLINKKLKVCLVEKNNIGCGVTSRTTGKLTYLQENVYSKLKTYIGLEKAKLYLDSQKDAIKIVIDIIEKENINCDLEKNSSYIFSYKDDNKLEKERKTLLDLNVTIKDSNKLPNNEEVNDAFYVDDTYVFHPLKYVHALKDICMKKNIDIYENTKVTSMNNIDGIYYCEANKKIIKAKYVVLALHYPYFIIPFEMPLKCYLEKSYIEAFKTEKNYKFNAITVSKPTISMRYHSDNKDIYEIYLTNSHNLCVKNNEKDNFNDLKKARKNNPDYIWSNKDIITEDYLPYIGYIDKEKNILIGTGYNTWGMTNGSLAGKILSDIILDKENKYIDLFNPKRGINLGKVINFPVSLVSNIYSFTKTKLKKQKSWYFSNVIFEEIDGKQIATYIDENKVAHTVYNICPHFKCSLIFNEIEKTWDCPCHGSRFDLDGKCIEGPSNYNITYKKEKL